MLDGLIRLLEWLGDKWETNLSPYFIISDYEGGVLLRLGKYKKTLKRGSNWKYPLIDSIVSTNIAINTYAISNVNITTLDNKTVTVSGILEIDIFDVKKYLIDINDADSNAADLARGIIADYLSDCTWEEVKDKKTLTKIKNKLKPEFAEMGITVRKLLFGDIAITRMYTVIKE
jgi:regulator of protease activity HflC (stomatin/prohibitin superfamily)